MAFLFSLLSECLKTKSEVISVDNRKGHWQSNGPKKLEENTFRQRKAREDVREFGFTSDKMSKWR